MLILSRTGAFLNSMVSSKKSKADVYARYGVPCIFDLVLIKKNQKEHETILKKTDSYLSMLSKALDSIPVIIFSETFDSDSSRFLSETPCYTRIEHGIIFHNVSERDIKMINPKWYNKLYKQNSF